MLIKRCAITSGCAGKRRKQMDLPPAARDLCPPRSHPLRPDFLADLGPADSSVSLRVRDNVPQPQRNEGVQTASKAKREEAPERLPPAFCSQVRSGSVFLRSPCPPPPPSASSKKKRKLAFPMTSQTAHAQQGALAITGDERLPAEAITEPLSKASPRCALGPANPSTPTHRPGN